MRDWMVNSILASTFYVPAVLPSPRCDNKIMSPDTAEWPLGGESRQAENHCVNLMKVTVPVGSVQLLLSQRHAL